MGEPIRSRSVGSVMDGIFRFCATRILIMNIGLTLLQKERRYAHSSCDMQPLRYRSAATLPPIGYPQRNPDSTANEPQELILKTRHSRGRVMCNSKESAFVLMQRLQMRINGNNVGSTTLNHRRSPSLAPESTAAGKQSMAKKQIIKNNAYI